MKGGHADAYYYQLASFIRRYKGVRPPPAVSPARRIVIDRSFSQWEGVEPVYRDDAGYTVHRDWPGYNNHVQYTNTTGRNDLVLAQVARDEEHVFFRVSTREPLTPPAGDAWMLLLIDTDSRHETGWEGYDLLINRSRTVEGSCSIERSEGKWEWRSVGEARLAWDGCDLHLAVPRELIEPTAEGLQFEFTWADNVFGEDNTLGEANVAGGGIMNFTTDGDVAPNGRFHYSYAEPAGR